MPTYEAFPTWLNLRRSSNGSFDLGSIKSALEKKGLGRRGWRLYRKYGDELFSPLRPDWIDEESKGFSSQYAAVDWLRLLQDCETDLLPPVELAASMWKWNVSGSVGMVPPDLFKAAWEEIVAASYRQENLSQFVQTEIVPQLLAFFANGCHLEYERYPLKRGWPVVSEFYAETKAENDRLDVLRGLRGRVAGRPDEQHVFPHPIRTLETGPYRFDALESERAVRLEGEAMRHCIGGFGERLAKEMLLAYSVRDRMKGSRLATLTIRESAEGYWKIDQLKGPQNQIVSLEVELAAFELIRTMEEAYADLTSVRRYLNGLREASASDSHRPADLDDEMGWYPNPS